MVINQSLIQYFMNSGARVWEALVQREVITPEARFTNKEGQIKLRHYSEEHQAISAADNMQEFICLLDPHGVIHLSSGILPVQSIQIPPDFIIEPLKQLEVAFFTAPVLGPVDQIEVSLPKEQAYTWSWKEQNSWTQKENETTGKKQFSNENEPTELSEEDINAFQTQANFPEQTVLREGELILKHKEEKTD